jgi:hypothetical protein
MDAVYRKVILRPVTHSPEAKVAIVVALVDLTDPVLSDLCSDIALTLKLRSDVWHTSEHPLRGGATTLRLRVLRSRSDDLLDTRSEGHPRVANTNEMLLTELLHRRRQPSIDLRRTLHGQPR